MLNARELSAWLDAALPAAERARLAAALAQDAESRREVLAQQRMDAALAAALGGAAADARVKRAVLAVLRGEPEAELKRQILREATGAARPSISGRARWWPRRSAPAWLLAAACLALTVGIWHARRMGGGPAFELPTLVVVGGRPLVPWPGAVIRAAPTASASVTYRDGTVVHLEPRTEVALVAADHDRGGKQFALHRGLIAAEVAPQPRQAPLLIRTPEALVTVVGTVFDLDVAAGRTTLAVTRGQVNMAGAGTTAVVQVAAGEYAVAAPREPVRYGRLARHPFLWPFSSASIWNRPRDSKATFAPIEHPGWAAAIAHPSILPRRPFLGGPADPLRRIWIGDAAVADMRLPDARLPGAGMRDSLVLMQQGRRMALEAVGVRVRPDGDLDADDLLRLPLNGPGTYAAASPAARFGLSALGGLLRADEIETGIRHALAVRVPRAVLMTNGAGPQTVWPATGNPVPAGDDGRAGLCIGDLLAIPPERDVATAAGSPGPAVELGRALQDYGAYVAGVSPDTVVLMTDRAPLPDVAEALSRLLPLLQRVTNPMPAAAGGGGTPRREPAPSLPGESSADGL